MTAVRKKTIFKVNDSLLLCSVTYFLTMKRRALNQEYGIGHNDQSDHFREVKVRRVDTLRSVGHECKQKRINKPKSNNESNVNSSLSELSSSESETEQNDNTMFNVMFQQSKCCTIQFSFMHIHFF